MSYLSERFAGRRLRLTSALVIAILGNLLLLAAYVWSRGGQTTHVRLEARGDEFAAYVDGRLAARATFQPPAAGGVFLKLQSPQQIPSLPEPRGVESVRVSDLASGRVLYETDFSSGIGSEWAVREGSLQTGDGVVGTSRAGTLGFAEPSWSNYAVDVTYRNITNGEVMLASPDGRSGVAFRLRPFQYFTSELALVQDGRTIQSSQSGLRLELGRGPVIRSIVAMALRPYPYAAVLLALSVAAVFLLQFARLPALRLPSMGIPVDGAWLAAAAVSVAVVGISLYVHAHYGARIPHVPDELSYIFQAKLFSSGHVSAPPPPVFGAFESFFPPLIPVSDGKWASAYPLGHSLMLALGVRIGALWLVPPLVAGASVAMLFAIGRRMFNARVGLVAAALLASSPFFLMNASSYMGHNTAGFYLLASLLCLTAVERRPLLFAALAGVSFGLLFNTRPLTGLALIPPFGLLLLSPAIRKEDRSAALRRIGAFVAGGLVMVAAYLLYNYGTTGDPLLNGYNVQLQNNPNVSCSGLACGSLAQGVGFEGRHTPYAGIQNEQTHMAYYLLVLNGWPLYIGLTLVLLPFALGTRKLWDWFLLACALCVMAASAIFEGTGIMYGPRYWYETLPFAMLLTARGGERAAELLAAAAAWMRRGPPGAHAPSAWAGHAVVYGLVAALTASALYGWLLGRHTTWRVDFVPESAQALERFNQIDDRLTSLVDEADLDNALVLVEPCGNWQCYGTVFWLNSPQLDGDVVYARNLPDRQPDLFKAFPDRRVYVATYLPQGTLVPYGYELPASGAQPDGELPPAPLARDIALPEPTAVPTPDTAELAARDAQRRADLAAVAEALQQYYERHAAYPVATSPQALCGTDEDAGCALKEVLDPLPRDPNPAFTYLYQSDGTRFALFASSETPNPEPCTDRPPELRIFANLYCLRGGP